MVGRLPQRDMVTVGGTPIKVLKPKWEDPNERYFEMIHIRVLLEND